MRVERAKRRCKVRFFIDFSLLGSVTKYDGGSTRFINPKAQKMVMHSPLKEDVEYDPGEFVGSGAVPYDEQARNYQFK
jgi:hypothetical protein